MRRRTLNRLRRRPRRLCCPGYDLEADPAERRNVIEEHPEVAARLSDQLGVWSASIPSQAPPPERDEEQLEMLRALGYVD